LRIPAPNGAPLRGREKVLQLYTNLFARFDVPQKFHFEEIQSMGDWAFGWGTDDITMTPGGGPPAHYAEHGIAILRRDSDNI
jgi:ketosteroid isomerase-like protein